MEISYKVIHLTYDTADLFIGILPKINENIHPGKDLSKCL